MIERFPARAGSLNRYRQVFFDFGLADEFRQAPGTQFEFKRRIVFDRRGRDQPIFQVGIFFDRSHWADSTTSLGAVPGRFACCGEKKQIPSFA